MLRMPLSMTSVALEFISVWFLAALMPLVVVYRWPDSSIAIALQRSARLLGDSVLRYPAVIAAACVVAIAILLRPKLI